MNRVGCGMAGRAWPHTMSPVPCRCKSRQVLKSWSQLRVAAASRLYGEGRLVICRGVRGGSRWNRQIASHTSKHIIMYKQRPRMWLSSCGFIELPLGDL